MLRDKKEYKLIKPTTPFLFIFFKHVGEFELYVGGNNRSFLFFYILVL
jgi:hypothetical protein